MQECGLFIEIGPLESLIGFTGTVAITVNNGQVLRFKGELGKILQVDLKGLVNPVVGPVLQKFGRKPLVNPADVVHNYLEARFAMIGFWKKAYGIPFLHVGNVI